MSDSAPRTSENHTIPDPHLTREEAKALLRSFNRQRGDLASVEAAAAACHKLRNSLSAPLVEDGGVEISDEAAEFWAARQLTRLTGGVERLDSLNNEKRRDELLRYAREDLAAIQPFLGQGDETQYRVVVRQSGEVMPLGIEPLGCCASRLRTILAAAPGTEIEDAWGERRSVTYGRWERCPVQHHKEEEKV